MRQRRFFWCELTTRDFLDLDFERTVAVLPTAAVEQHGPHLPVVTDTAIADGMVALLRERLPDDLAVLALPTLAIGKSNEHLLSAGTLSFSAETFTRMLVEVGASVRRAGLRKVAIINAHGGNTDLLAVVVRELRVSLGLLAVTTDWQRFGLPEGVYDDFEKRYGIHGGDIETSLMLHFRPDLVRMEKAKNFISNAAAIETEFAYLRAEGSHAFGWIAQDLNSDGVMGNAAIATAEKGRCTAEHQVEGFIGLLRDMANFRMDRLHAADDADVL